MPKFNKPLEEIETHFDKWLYVLRHLNELETIPSKLTERIFKKLFTVAEIAKFTREQLMAYEESMKYYWDLKNSFDTQFREGMKEGERIGIEKGKMEEKMAMAKAVWQAGLDRQMISKITGLTEAQLAVL